LNQDWLTTLKTRFTDRQVDLDEVLRQLVDASAKQLGGERGTLYLVDHARQELVSRVAKLVEISEIRLRMGEGIAGTVARSGRPIVVSDATTDARVARRFDQLTGFRTQSLAAVPIFDQGGQVIGVLQLLNKETGRWHEGRDTERLAIFAAAVAEVLDVTSLRSQLLPEIRQPLSFRFNHIVGESAPMRKVYDRIDRAAATEATVLIRGESGTGKELIARAMHDNSHRRDGPFVKVDCAALPEHLIENELFGHEKGAFTGAAGAAYGKVQVARGGTLFLDEVGELPASVQGKLLRLIQDQTFFRVGGHTAETADVRFVAATNRPLEKDIKDGSFRLDLYYRLRVVEVLSPPLRERGGGDLDRLIDHFLYELSRRHDRPNMRLSSEALAELHAYDWPGNVRELENTLESAIVLSPQDTITTDTIYLVPTGASDGSGFRVNDDLSLALVEKAYVQHVVDKHDGNKSRAAAALGIGRNTLLRKLKG
jgi:Nif-specific regulatory protein